MIKIPPIQTQDQLSEKDQIKNLRSYIYQLATELQRELVRIETRLTEIEKGQ